MLDVSSETVLHAVFHTLAYADVFEYPLTAGETHRYLTSEIASIEEVTQALAQETLFTPVGQYFTLRGREHLVEIRKRRAEIAARLWPAAARYGRMIASLPFVRMVAVTGSLAMDNTEGGKDVDFMLVTAPDRLWTVRALSLLIARFARLQGVSLCPNYLVTTNALKLQERSLYVAHELAQMIPLSGKEMYEELRRLNDWADAYLPNATGAPELRNRGLPPSLGSTTRKLLELLFRFPVFAWFEEWEMDRKIVRLSREQSSSFESYFSKDICKGHLDKHAENVVTALALRLQKATSVITTKVA